MVTAIRLYVEGHPRLHSGFGAFLSEIREAAREHRVGWNLSMGQGRTVRDFMKGLRAYPDAFHVLLIDSDGYLTFDQLKTRSDWMPSHEVTGDQVHWMVEIMESWFLADRQALRDYYGSRFRESALPRNPDVERIPKKDVLDGLKKATDGAYHKVVGASKILERLNPRQVRKHAPHCEQLFVTLLSQLSG